MVKALLGGMGRGGFWVVEGPCEQMERGPGAQLVGIQMEGPVWVGVLEVS